MSFNSWEYIIFFLVTYTIYTILPRYRWQNWLLLFASYYFYAAWDWRFCFLILGVTIINYLSGSVIDSSASSRNRKYVLVICVCLNLGILGFFKYYNFFIESLDSLVDGLGWSAKGLHLNVILPVGISFYTFQVMSYTIDIYRKELQATRNFLDFALFVSFFPQLVAGPIERAKRLLPQICQKRIIESEHLRTGSWLIFWGLYKKIVIADNLAAYADTVFLNSASATSLMVYLGAFAFSVQIYCDFSAYTDIARGCARLMGFDLMRNFNLPYFAKNPGEFWHRWHISLSTWLRDYLYIPLGGNRKGQIRTYINLFLTMLLGGLWHGASWNFVWWGAFHGVLLIVHRFVIAQRRAKSLVGNSWIEVLKIFVMFNCTLIGWLLFRANRRVIEGEWTRDDSLNQIIELITSFRNGIGIDNISLEMLGNIILFTLPLAIIQWAQYRRNDHYILINWKSPLKVPAYAILVFTWLIWGVQSGDSFIYFQF